ncbi:MAG: D-2-hydroxyacid dehydrogenase [Rhizobiales bacterium]|nr:D-2-hydroxyacid dehydrogenase [Hyphomicrobiales bacterium]
MRIFVCVSLTGAQRSRLEAALAADEVHYDPDAESAPHVFADFEVAFGNPPADWLLAGAALRWVQLESVGFGEYGELDWDELGKRLKISNLAGFFAEPVAESILAGVLSHFRGIGALAILQERREWVGEALRPSLKLLRDAHVVLFGAGAINGRVRELLQPFGCRIMRFGRGFEGEALEASLREADIVICTVPHTPDTKGLFDRRMIGLLKQGSLFVNFGRGSLIDEQVLAEALDSGRIGGAVIDVTQDEPLPPDHRFWTCKNMLLTQHTGGGTSDEVDRKIDLFIANLERYRRGDEPWNLVDFKRGY